MSCYLSILTWSLNNWISVWMIMEISVLFLIGLMSLGTNYMSSSLMMKFFIIQLLISLAFMITALIYVMNMFTISCNFICLMFLLMKMGLFPFHFWLISILGKMGWLSFFILTTLMKLPPLNLSYYLFDFSNLMLVCASSLIVGGLLGMNNLSIQKILGYSSMTHLCWIMLSLTLSLTVYWFYFIGYSYTMIILLGLFSKLNMFYLNHFKLYYHNKFYLFSMLFIIISLSGFPPFLGFLMKWAVSTFMVFCNFKVLIVLMISFSVFSTVFYFQLFYYFILVYNSSLKLYSSIYMSFISFKLMFLVLIFYLAAYFMI
uniref:NADH-ubiquinone oxidoreductase chain 2 n=1 Tax=Pealius mori TaxID=1453199 RepID=A0A7G2CTK3_9HEMI|nr:NADH dehydrogenase subunit 2 [Pealius mori]WPM91815.1 NADH dehydrogenase subunit 2 [Pealius mori]CAD5105732.1 NADH dehydrogenase subunit 2 [Pealius mori]